MDLTRIKKIFSSTPAGFQLFIKRLMTHVPAFPRRFRAVILSLLAISALAAVTNIILSATSTGISRKAWEKTEIAQSTKNRLTAIAIQLDSARDWLINDPVVVRSLISRSTTSLFPLLRQRDSTSAARFPDSVLYVSTAGGRHIAEHGSAIYSADGRLLAWYSSRPTTFGFDTVLSGASLLPNRDRDVILENDPIYAYLNSIRRFITKEGKFLGYAVSKRLLAVKEPLSFGQTSSFIDDIKDNAHRDIDLSYGGVAGHAHSADGWTRLDLYAEPGNPSSYVGNLSISDQPAADPSGLYKFLRTVWSLGFSIVAFALLLWLISSVAEMPQSKRPLVTRFGYSVVIIFALLLTRIIFSELGGLALLVGPQYQDPRDFASDWSWGMLQNPLELFITSLFATAGAVLLWIIWMPRKRLLRDDSQRKGIEEIVRQEALRLILYSLVAVVASQLLTDALSFVTEAIVNNGQLRYLVIKQVLPSPPMLMMLLSFLGLGVTYLFLNTLFLTFALRATIYLLPRKLALWTRILGGTAIFSGLIIAAAYALDSASLSSTNFSYRLALAGITLVISIAIILIDAFAYHSSEETPSFLYRLPRSSRSILFILAASALIMGPIIAQKQLRTDKEIAQNMVEESAQVDAPLLQTVAANVFVTAQQKLEDWASSSDRNPSALRQQAFLMWLTGLHEHQDWNAAIDIFDAQNNLVSHFATAGVGSELYRLKSVHDSALREVRAINMPTARTLKTVACFTGSCTPAILGALKYSPQSPTNLTPFYISVSLWSDLAALATSHSSFDLLGAKPDDATATDPLSDGGFIVAQYRPNVRRITNAPSLDVPANVPAFYEYRLQNTKSFWHATEISGAKYQTLYYRATPVPRKGETPTIITVSVPEPSQGRTMEFALRLNAVGLVYGSLIALVLLIIRQVSSRRVRFTLRFRDRIFLIVLLIALVPLVVVTNVTRTLLTERAHLEENNRLARDASVIKERVAGQLEAEGVNTFGLALQSDVNDLAEVIGRDFSVYDATGLLRASSRPELYESSLLASNLSSNAVQEVILGKKSFYSEPLRLNQLQYEIGFQPVTSTQGNRLLSVISLTTMDEQSRIEAEISRTTSFIYGTFAALGLVLLGIGALFAARVASPILSLIQATESVAQGKLKTSIPVNREDEIGELMHAFNTMTFELEKSRTIVAQNEREFAWKEMARQVAHEIKNPLTPMKLSVQHLDHAHEAKDPNFNSIFRRVIRTLSEQIDVLTRIATEFSRFGEMPRRKWGPVSLHNVAESAVALFDAERSRVRFIIDVPEELSNVHADEEELRRAFVNLIRNAAQATEGWGVIAIRAVQEKGMIHVRLSDTGGGMSEETLRKAFDPNFSTKTSGMGLGLAIVKKTITDMSGTIRVESKLGHGTTFFIDLPARGYVEEADRD